MSVDSCLLPCVCVCCSVISATGENGLIQRAVNASRAYNSIIDTIREAETSANLANQAAMDALKVTHTHTHCMCTLTHTHTVCVHSHAHTQIVQCLQKHTHTVKRPACV